MIEIDQPGDIGNPGIALGSSDTSLPQAKANIVCGCRPRQQTRVLEYHSVTPIPSFHLPTQRRHEPGRDLQECGLARAGWSEQCNAFTSLDLH